MKYHVGLTIDSKLFKKIEEIRGREKRSTFVEYLIKLGLEIYMKNKALKPHTTNYKNK